MRGAQQWHSAPIVSIHLPHKILGGWSLCHLSLFSLSSSLWDVDSTFTAMHGLTCYTNMQVGTLGFVYPGLLLIYFGEAAYLARFPQHFAQAFYRAVPERVFWPAFVIATASALVGSQSLITSTFSVVRLSARLACFPPVKVRPGGPPHALHAAKGIPPRPSRIRAPGSM